MSAGDRNDPDPVSLVVANQIVRSSLVQANMRRHFVVSKQFDIPYLAGYRVDGHTIYIDRDLSPWPFERAKISTDRFLTLHEQVEKSVIDALRDNQDSEAANILLNMLRMRFTEDAIYYHCHGVATAMEEGAVRLSYGAPGVDSYNAFMRSQVKRAGDERIRSVPPDLDLTPYTSSETAEDRRLLNQMKRAM